jgi:hypothetical protein
VGWGGGISPSRIGEGSRVTQGLAAVRSRKPKMQKKMTLHNQCSVKMMIKLGAPKLLRIKILN